ncbi:tumor necrosis factor ligand superfamily member 6-like [Scyliorhinus canicula]|uniref:Tumor necrosis factor ligand superfamily member 6 n=1 Tax=Scyliorhinus canicula TaxID=7830 RepID=A0A977SRJ5_SCYCA|nr:tumor necrosis factor ligand superfamily member 6-like [Scyliorhinus canicula]UXO99700.1 TNFSF6 [Scyliorhinus canicula]
MQQNYLYPQVFMVDGSQNLNPYVPPPAWALPTLKKKRKLDWRTVGTILLLNLVLLALAGLALGTVYLLELQKEIQEMKQDNGGKGPVAHKIIGAQNFTQPPKDLRIAAHLTGDSITAGSNPLVWDDQKGHAFTSGILYKDRGLVINKAGIFFVYSKIYFRSYVCDRKNLEHIVFKRTDRYRKELILMEAKKTNYCSGNGWATNSYQAGIIHLLKGESIYVNVSDSRLVDFAESKTFFGLYKL